MSNDEHAEADSWTTVRRKTQTYVIRKYWNGFDAKGRRKWYIELSDGRHLGQPHGALYAYWDRKAEVCATPRGAFTRAP